MSENPSCVPTIRSLPFRITTEGIGRSQPNVAVARFQNRLQIPKLGHRGVAARQKPGAIEHIEGPMFAVFLKDLYPDSSLLALLHPADSFSLRIGNQLEFPGTGIKHDQIRQ